MTTKTKQELQEELEALQKRLSQSEENLQTLQKHDHEYHAAEELTRLILDQSAEVIFVCDQNGRIIRASHIAYRFFASKVLKRPFDNVCRLKLSSTSPLEMEVFSVSSVLSGKFFRALEVTHERNDHQVFHFLLNARPLVHEQREVLGCVVTLIDITDRKRAEEELRQRTLELQKLTKTLEQRVQERTAELAEVNDSLRELSSKLLSAHEDERKKIASEVHDNLAACLAAIKFKVESTLDKAKETPNDIIGSLSTVVPIIQDTIQECRNIQMDLRPSMIDDLGLLPTLSWFFRRFETIYPAIRVEEEIDIEESDVPSPLKIVVYRVIQEAMNNISKHSHADRARLGLRKFDGRVELQVTDNGRGFNMGKAPDTESRGRGLGLTSMRERVELSGGSFTIKSDEGKGTMMHASWPIG